MVAAQVRRVAVAAAQYGGVALQLEVERGAGIGHQSAPGVQNLDRDDGHVQPVGRQLLAVGGQSDAVGRLGGLDGLRHHATALLVARGHHAAGLVDGLPLQVAVAGHPLTPQPLAVDGQLHLVAVAVGPQLNLLALMAVQVPVGEDVERRLVGPPRLQVPGLVLPESAVVQHAELRLVGGERERVRLAPVVEARPEEAARRPRMFGIESPSALDDVLHVVMRRVAVHRHHPPGLVGAVEVDAARAAAGGFLRTHHLPFRMLAATVLHVVLRDVVVAHHVDALDEFRAAGIGQRRGPRGVHQPDVGPHGLGNAAALLGVLHAPLLVAAAPEDDAGVVAVAAYHAVEQPQVLVVDAREAVLVDHQHPQSVADVQLCGRHGVVAGPVGVAPHLLQLPDAPLHQRLGQGHAHAGMVLVHVEALQLQRPSVEQEPAVGIETDVAHADRGLVDVGHAAVHPDRRLHLIYIWVVGAPEPRAV